MTVSMEHRIRNVTAVLGPTNTGKTHLAIERMLGHETGLIGLPLRLLAREVYDKIVARVGAGTVALITGEEKIKPEGARYWVSTVEAMPRDIDTDFLAIDEVQLCADPERGHVFTDRLLNARGKLETLLLGAGTMRDAISDLIPGANFISRPRLSKLSYAGEKKLTRLPARSAVVAFSAADVYSIAELIRRQRGGAAVVLGALSPRTRNAQVALYQSGDVDYLVATDAIGMGLNLDVDHVAIAATRKFDGQVFRELTPSELGQIAGRAGRHMNDGTFGVTGGIDSLSADLIERLENHTFDPVKLLQWRTRSLDFTNLELLRESLRAPPREVRLQRARMADDVMALETLAADREIVELARGRMAVERLWEVCQIPDYRKISSSNHAELVAQLYKFLMAPAGRIPEDWFSRQVAFSERTDGDIDTLSNRLAHIRTWTFVSNRTDWLADPLGWQEKTRAIEDTLSDALHEQLTQRFVDWRTSALMRGMRDKDEMVAEIAIDGAVHVEKHFVGRLRGFSFVPETLAEDVQGKATRAAAAHVVSKELTMRARRVVSARADAFRVTPDGKITWRDEPIAALAPGEDPLKPQVQVLADEHLAAADREKVQERLVALVAEIVADRLKPLVDIAKAEDISGLGRGIAFRLVENFGVLRRETVADEIKSLDQAARAQLRKYGVRFGAFNIFFPVLLKPAASELTLALWALKHAGQHGLALDALPARPRAGLTSIATDPAVPEAFYRAVGFHPCGPRAVRIDMLERLADQIRPLLAWRNDMMKPGVAPPAGASGDGGFIVIPGMMSILGCSGDELGHVLRALGFRVDRKPKAQWLAARAAALERAEAKAAAEAAAKAVAEAAKAAAEAAPADGANASAGDVAADVPAAAGDTTSELAEAVGAEPVATEVAAEPTAVSEPAVPAEPAIVAAEPPVVEVHVAPAGDAPVASDGSYVAQPGSDTAAAGAADAAPAEPELIDIWRPRRHRDEQRRPRQGDRRGDQQRRHHRPHGSRPAGVPAPQPAVAGAPAEAGAPAAEAVATNGEAQREGRPWRERRDDKRNDRDGGDRRRDQRTPGKPGDRPRDGQSKGDRGKDFRGGRGGGDRRGGERPPQQYLAAPPKSRGPDPDSPFAALSALKAALEKGQKEG
ncbi:MAG: helicase [Hyphomicrobiales bacterium]|nr:helicase [Hyphomicrobiales bacterium]